MSGAHFKRRQGGGAVLELLPHAGWGHPINTDIEKSKDIVEVVAKAIFEVTFKTAVDEIDQVKVSITDARGFFLDLRGETDAALVVLATSYIDTHLTDSFKQNMSGLSSGDYEAIFDNDGPLATWSAKIRIAHALGWMTQGTTNDLHILRKIRNLFAHDPYKRALHEAKINSYITSMMKREQAALDAVRKENHIRELKPRDLFHVRAAMLCFEMTLEMCVAPISDRNRVSKGKMITDYESGPELLRSMRREQAAFLIDYFFDVPREGQPTLRSPQPGTP